MSQLPLAQSSATRTLKLAVVALIVSNLVVGLFSWRTVHTLDERYSSLIDRSTPVLNDIQTLSAKAAIALRRTNPSLLVRDGSLNREGISAALQAIEEDRRLRETLLSKPWLPSTDQKRGELGVSGREFTVVSERVVALLAEKRTAEAARLHENEGYIVFERYLSAATFISDQLSEEALRNNANLTRESTFNSKIAIAIGGWPLLLASSLLLATLVFVVSLLVLFRVRESAD